MPAYRAIRKGFMNNRIYEVGDSMSASKPFTKANKPSWVELVEDKEEASKIIEEHNNDVRNLQRENEGMGVGKIIEEK